MIYSNQNAVKVTHIPTGFSVIVERSYNVSIKSLTEIAKKVLMIRMLAQRETLSDVYEYDLPNGQEYPHELMMWRKEICKNE